MTTRITPAPAYQRPSGKLYLSAEQPNLVSGDITLVELETIAAGFADGIEDTANHKITPGVAGFYLLTGRVTFVNVVADRGYDANIRINGATYACFNYNWCGGGTRFSLPLAALVKLTATDYLELMARSVAGVDTVDVSGGLHNTFLSIQRVR